MGRTEQEGNMPLFHFHPKWVKCNPLPTLTSQSECQTPRYKHSVLENTVLTPPRPTAPGCTQAICTCNRLVTSLGFPHLLSFANSIEQLIDLRTTLYLGLRFYYKEWKRDTQGKIWESPGYRASRLPPSGVRVFHPAEHWCGHKLGRSLGLQEHQFGHEPGSFQEHQCGHGPGSSPSLVSKDFTEILLVN